MLDSVWVPDRAGRRWSPCVAPWRMIREDLFTTSQQM